MGSQTQRYLSGMGGSRTASSSIVALDWNTQGKLLWEQKSTTLVLPNRPPDRNNNRTVSFEGTPVADARNVYVAVTDRREQTATYIACFDADTGAVRWIRYLGAASPDGNNNFGFMGWDAGQRDLAGRLQPSAALARRARRSTIRRTWAPWSALEAETGLDALGGDLSPAGAEPVSGNGSERDLNPAVVHDGRVFVAPSDADAIFAFDAGSGRLLWKTDPIADDVKLSHLLGWPRGGWSPPATACCSSTSRPASCSTPGPTRARSLEGYGRGLLAGDIDLLADAERDPGPRPAHRPAGRAADQAA